LSKNRQFQVLIKTVLGFENIVKNRIKEIDPSADVLVAPKGFKGLVLAGSNAFDKDKFVKVLNKELIEAEKIIPIDLIVRADPNEICKGISGFVNEKISSDETFAVRTTRRGRHKFTSIDVNIIVGDCVRKYTGASVNLRYPDKIVLVEIIGEEAYISILPGSFEYHKYAPEKKELYRFFNKLSIIQMPYLGPIESVIEIGKRIGREVQNFEVKELVIAPIGLVDAYSLARFIDSVMEGIESRYRVQVKSYHRKPRKTPVYIMDLYQLIRDRGDEVIIVFEPEGRYIVDVKDELEELVLKSRKRINLLFGAREGIPTGIFRYADLVIDIAPGMVLSTDYAVAAGLIALSTILYDKYRSMDHESINTSGR